MKSTAVTKVTNVRVVGARSEWVDRHRFVGSFERRKNPPIRSVGPVSLTVEWATVNGWRLTVVGASASRSNGRVSCRIPSRAPCCRASGEPFRDLPPTRVVPGNPGGVRERPSTTRAAIRAASFRCPPLHLSADRCNGDRRATTVPRRGGNRPNAGKSQFSRAFIGRSFRRSKSGVARMKFLQAICKYNMKTGLNCINECRFDDSIAPFARPAKPARPSNST